MCEHRTVAIILLTILLVGLVNFEESDAALSPKSCKIECQPPSLGLDLEKLRRHVSEGFGINDQFFDVEYFSQTIPTQNFTVGDTVNVRLKIFENTGYQYLRYVGLSIIVDEPLIRGGMQVEEYKSTIAWIKKFDGTKSIDVDDSYDLFDIINVTDSVENNRTILNYEFRVTNPIESKTIAVKMWDKNRNVWSNHFYEAITVIEKDSKFTIPFENMTINLNIENVDKSEIPEWVKNIFGWYAQGEISEDEFLKGIEYLVEKGIVNVN